VCRAEYLRLKSSPSSLSSCLGTGHRHHMVGPTVGADPLKLDIKLSGVSKSGPRTPMPTAPANGGKATTARRDNDARDDGYSTPKSLLVTLVRTTGNRHDVIE